MTSPDSAVGCMLVCVGYVLTIISYISNHVCTLTASDGCEILQFFKFILYYYYIIVKTTL